LRGAPSNPRYGGETERVRPHDPGRKAGAEMNDYRPYS